MLHNAVLWLSTMCLALLCWHPKPQSVCLIWRLRLGFVCDHLIVHLKSDFKGLHLAALQIVKSRVV
jgi:hypothetical protein